MTNQKWSNISDNPNDPKVVSYLKKELSDRRMPRYFSSMELFRDFISGQAVLDIGVVEHSSNYFDSPNWKHAHFVRWAREVVGIDILAHGVEELKKRGYNVLLVDATSETDLGSRFERIVIGDVIEHVNNPVDLLRFAKRHLAKDGQVLVTTPNPYWFKLLFRLIREGMCIASADHVSWISPPMAIELGQRAGLKLVGYHAVQSHGSGLLTRSLHRLRDQVAKNSDLFAWTFGYVYALDEVHPARSQ